MGTQLGIWNFDGYAPNEAWIRRAASRVRSSPSEVPEFASDRGIAAVSSRVETCSGQSVFPRGFFLLWDGRLDNREELLGELGSQVPVESVDGELVSASYARWKTAAFARLLGDWSLVIWEPGEQALILAKDPIGTKPLYYHQAENAFLWSSDLQLLVQTLGSSLPLDKEYMAGWLSLFPASGLTPYEPIESVLPSTYFRFSDRQQKIVKYWDFSPDKELDCRTDVEFDEQFRQELRKAVRRRLRANGPVLAELSGGMDSSSIVSIADTLAVPDCESRPDTISYYDDSEPNWNERPYFLKIEEKRGRTGFHIPIDASEELRALFALASVPATPAECGKNSRRHRDLVQLVKECGYVALLSGTGGDEFTGGVPAARPELSDLLAAGKPFRLLKQAKAWALGQRRPWIHLLLETLSGFLPLGWIDIGHLRKPAAWLTPQFVRRHGEALSGYDRRLSFFGSRPSFQENLSTLEVIRRQLACTHSSSRSAFETRYPYLDRDLLEFLFAVPRPQLVQPGRRRAMMRRALIGIVPEEILSRKRKAYVARAPRTAILAHWDSVQELATDMTTESMGIVSGASFRLALDDVRAGKEVPIQEILRTLVLERWLRGVSGQSCSEEPATTDQMERSRALHAKAPRVA